MLKRPSSRRKSNPEQIRLMLVPIIDTMVALIAFLLFTTSFLALVSIESPFPQVSPSQAAHELKEKPLQLTVTLGADGAEVWSPFDRIAPKKIPNTAPGIPDAHGIHEALVAVKQKFPAETKVIVVPKASTSYDVLISVMDAMRSLDAGDPPVFAPNGPGGTARSNGGAEKPVKALFPEIVFGNLLGDT